MGSDARAPATGRSSPAWLLIVFGLAFLGCGLLALGVFGRAWRDYSRTASWERVPARIESVELETHTALKGGSTCAVKARYRFDRDGSSRLGTRVTPEGGFSRDPRERVRYELLKQHQEGGQPFLAWVNPADPDESLLFREMEPRAWLLLAFGLVLAAFGAAAGLAGVWRLRSG